MRIERELREERCHLGFESSCTCSSHRSKWCCRGCGCVHGDDHGMLRIIMSNGVCSRSRHMSSWGSKSSRSVHGDERGMLRIISPLGKDPTSDRDPHHHGNGCRGRTCSWTKLKTLRNPSTPRCLRSGTHAKRANTSDTRKYNGKRTQGVHHVRMSP